MLACSICRRNPLTKPVDLARLEAEGQAQRVFTLRQKREIAAYAYRRRWWHVVQMGYRTIKGVEHLKLETLRALKTGGTVLEPAQKALVKAGVPVGETVGEFMDALSITQDELHHAVCWCHEQSSYMTGSLAQARFSDLASRA